MWTGFHGEEQEACPTEEVFKKGKPQILRKATFSAPKG